jgi:hypothetical protein
LAGAPIVQVPFGTRYDEPGFTTSDSIDGNITPYTIVNGTDMVAANLEVPGAYTLTYTARDRYNNTANVTRRVQVDPFSTPDDIYIFRLEYSASPSTAPSATQAETGLRSSTGYDFLFVLSRYDPAQLPNRFNVLPDTRVQPPTTAPMISNTSTQPSRRRRLLATSTVFEFAVRDTATLQWLSTAELLDLPAQLVADVPGVASVRPATAKDKKGLSVGLIAAVAVCCALMLAVVLFLVYRKRQQRSNRVATDSTGLSRKDINAHVVNALYDMPELDPLAGGLTNSSPVWNGLNLQSADNQGEQPPTLELQQLNAVYDVPEMGVQPPTMWTQASAARLPQRNAELSGRNTQRTVPVRTTASLTRDARTALDYDDSII